MSVEEQLITAIDSEVIYAHMIHETFFSLFDSGDEVVKLLEDSDEQFFSLIHGMYLDTIALSFTRLLDSDKSCGNDNLSLFYLIDRTNLRGHPDYSKWNRELRAIRSKARKFFAVRNKVTGHLDLHTSVNRTSIAKPSFSRQDVGELYKLIAAWLSSVRAGVGMQPYLYTIGVANFQYARPLLMRLSEARKSLGLSTSAPRPPCNFGSQYS